MNFEYSEEQNLLKESIVRWAQDNYSFDQRRIGMNNEDGFDRNHWQTFAELGWLSVPFAEENGGYGGSVVDVAAIMQEFGKALVVEPVFPNILLFGGLLERSSYQGKVELLAGVIDGSVMGAVAMYEAQARFDVSNVLTSATESGDQFVINGSKSIVLGGAHAEKIIVLARTSGEQCDETGLSLFLVDAQASGLDINPYTLMDGQQVADIALENVSGELICELGSAYEILQATMQVAHVALAAEAVGIMEKLNATTVEYTKTRKQFGVAISSFQALQHRMVDTFMAYEQTRSLLVGTLCELTDDNTDAQQAQKITNALRALVGINGKLIGDEAIQMHGGMGITDELDVGHYVKRLMVINLMFGDAAFFQTKFNESAYA